MKVIDNLLYTKDHEWLKIKDNHIYIGITDFAQGELGDIIFVEFTPLNDPIETGGSISTIEAVKTVADIYTPSGGIITEINSSLEDAPELLNSNPCDAGWIVKIKIKENSFMKTLLTKEEYSALIS